jgi:hypothetical protein
MVRKYTIDGASVHKMTPACQLIYYVDKQTQGQWQSHAPGQSVSLAVAGIRRAALAGELLVTPTSKDPSRCQRQWPPPCSASPTSPWHCHAVHRTACCLAGHYNRAAMLGDLPGPLSPPLPLLFPLSVHCWIFFLPELRK